MSILIDYWFLDASSESSHNAEFLLNAVSDLGTAPAIVQECNQIAGHGILLKGKGQVIVKIIVRIWANSFHLLLGRQLLSALGQMVAICFWQIVTIVGQVVTICFWIIFAICPLQIAALSFYQMIAIFFMEMVAICFLADSCYQPLDKQELLTFRGKGALCFLADTVVAICF